MAEPADGLVCSVDALLDIGSEPADAAHRAVDEFGDPVELGATLAGQMMLATAHRTGIALVMSGPLIGVVWASAAGAALPTWLGKVGAVMADVRALPLVLVVTVPAAIIAIGGGGRLARILVVSRGWIYRAALLATGGCVAADATLVGAALIGSGFAMASVWLLVAAIALSVARASLAGAAMNRIVRQHVASG